MARLLDIAGEPIPVASLQISRAKWFAEFVARNQLIYVKLIECRRHDGIEKIIIDVEVERPQRPCVPIDRLERIAIEFSPQGDACPEVLALRDDFPRVPHTNLRPTEFPRSLCLYDQPWSQVVLRWTPLVFVERIRTWLAETARGTLHQSDQPLEPFLSGSGYRVILPPNLFDDAKGNPAPLELRFASAANDARVLIADSGQAKGVACIALSFVTNPQVHGVIRHAPRNLAELADLLTAAGIDLIGELRKVLPSLGQRDRRLAVIVGFPLQREGGRSVEKVDVWCFLTRGTVADVGIGIGLWEKMNDTLGLLVGGKPGADGANVAVDVLAPQFDFTRMQAARVSGAEPDRRRIVAVGAGALGSQVTSTLARSGFGQWTLVDDDVLLPHNLGRHALGRLGIGHNKALVMSFLIGDLYRSDTESDFIPANVITPGVYETKLREALKDAELILDMAASIPVSRRLAIDVESNSRRVALFLNPRGSDLVVLAEDAARKIRLDHIELQYLRSVATLPELAGHLARPEGQIRYARSCRDVSATIPNHLIGLHASIGAQAVRSAVSQDSASCRIWRAEPKSLSVACLESPITEVLQTSSCGWKFALDRHVLERMARARAEKLPNETGGVLIGAYDLSRRIVYVVDLIPSPPDSEEWPTLYIRGSEGLARRVAEIGRLTDGQLEYVGEWHSHPEECGCDPSADDLLVFSWLTRHMEEATLPGIMAIAGRAGLSRWFLGEITRDGGWQPG